MSAQVDMQKLLGRNIQRLRKKQRLSQEVLADRAGLGRNDLREVERGKRDISIGDIAKIATVLGVAPVVLFHEQARIVDIQRLFVRNMKRIRKEKGLDQNNLADLAGIDRTRLDEIERGKQYISMDDIAKIAVGLEILPDILFKKNFSLPVAYMRSMPIVTINQTELAFFGQSWIEQGKKLSRTPPYSSSKLGELFDNAVGHALATMLGGIPVFNVKSATLLPSLPNCVEVGPIRIIGGVRPQHFDVGYRPDGVRFVFDSKTLNDTKSIRKNWQNMVNDLATEAATVHSRFPHALVAFMVIIPEPCFVLSQQGAIIETLKRLARRTSVDSPDYLSEAVSLVIWDPSTGRINQNMPDPVTGLRIEDFSTQVHGVYFSRYAGFPPHAAYKLAESKEYSADEDNSLSVSLEEEHDFPLTEDKNDLLGEDLTSL